jgi:hypothetical protein
MPATILLPPSTTVYVTAMSNAAYLQKLTLTPPPGAGSPMSWQGTGEGDHIIGQTTLTTPAGSQDWSYSVNAQYSTDGGGTWQQSTLLPGGCTIATLNMAVLLSEDHVDQDYNDAVLQFIWWKPLS